MGALGSSLPQAGSAGRRAWFSGWRWGGVSPAWPGRFAQPRPAWAAGLPGPEWPQESFRPVSPLFHPWPVSSLGGLAQPWPSRALCCTYSRLVFIPCEDDILFLLSVSVFMCEELLACCACARGELVPGDWTA